MRLSRLDDANAGEGLVSPSLWSPEESEAISQLAPESAACHGKENMAEEEEAVREEEEEKLRVQMACGVDFEVHTPAPEPGKVFAPPTLTGLESLVTLVTLVIRSPRSFLCHFTRSTRACTGEDNDRYWLMMSFAAFTPFGGGPERASF